MTETFCERFKATEQKQDSNLLEIKLLEESALKKLLPLAEQPLERLSQRERLKVSRLRAAFPEQTKINSYTSSQKNVSSTTRADTASRSNQREQKLLLILALGNLFKTDVHKLRYTYYPRPILNPIEREDELKKRMNSIIVDLREKLGLAESYRNLFTKAGLRVQNIADFAQGEYTFFLSPMTTWNGLGDLSGTDRERVLVDRLSREVDPAFM
jgi:hypothetical protein